MANMNFKDMKEKIKKIVCDIPYTTPTRNKKHHEDYNNMVEGMFWLSYDVSYDIHILHKFSIWWCLLHSSSYLSCLFTLIPTFVLFFNFDLLKLNYYKITKNILFCRIKHQMCTINFSWHYKILVSRRPYKLPYKILN